MKALLFLALVGGWTSALAQDAVPLPNVPTLMKEVEANQKHAEDLQKDYIYKSSQRFEKLDGKGEVKKTQSELDEIFWINNVQVARTLEKNGKALTPDEAKKENERIDKESARIKERRDKAESEGKQTDARGHVVAPLSRYLELVTLANPRREIVAGRPTILIDFAGDPNAKTYNDPEKFVRELAGTMWIDEQDKIVQHLDATFVNPFKLGGGLFVNISKGTHFTLTSRKVNDEVWLPDSIRGNGHVRVLLFFAADGDFQLQTSEYRKFKASAKILPNFSPVAEPAETTPK